MSCSTVRHGCRLRRWERSKPRTFHGLHVLVIVVTPSFLHDRPAELRVLWKVVLVIEREQVGDKDLRTTVRFARCPR